MSVDYWDRSGPVTDGVAKRELKRLAEIGDLPVIPAQEICTGDFSDMTTRTGWRGTWTPTYTASSGTIIEDYIQIGATQSPAWEADITVNVDMGTAYFQLRDMYGRAFWDVQLLINGAAVTALTLQNYWYDDRRDTIRIHNDIQTIGSVKLGRLNVPANASIVVQARRRHSFISGITGSSSGRIISGLRSHLNIHYSPTSIVSGRQ